MAVRVECNNCGSRLKALESSIGKVLKCPKCGLGVKVSGEEVDKPANVSEAPASLQTQSKPRKTCPFCAEAISADAIKCRYCHSMLALPQQHPSSSPNQSTTGTKVTPSKGLNQLVTADRGTAKFVLRDAVIIFVITFLEGLLLGLFASATGMNADSLFSATFATNLFTLVACFTVSALFCKGSRWIHLCGVAVVLWFLSIVNVFFGFSLDAWLASIFFYAIIVGVSGVISMLISPDTGTDLPPVSNPPPLPMATEPNLSNSEFSSSPQNNQQGFQASSEVGCLPTLGAIAACALLLFALALLLEVSFGNLAWLFNFALVIASSIWVYIDAESIGVKKGQMKGIADNAPVTWLVGCLLLWIIFFPLYLVARPTLKAINGR